MFYPFESRIHTLATIKRERLLPRRGDVLVRTGEAVSAVDIIGRSHQYPRWHYVDVAGFFGVQPDAAESLLLKKPGDLVEADEVLASRKGPLGLFRKVYKSPAAGQIAAFRNGRLLIEEEGKPVEMRALLRGRVAGVMAGYGVVIETKGALIKAAWSGGPSTYGVLKLLADDPGTPLQAESIDIGSHGAVIVAGWCADVDALRQVEQIQARGVILGSIEAGLRREVERLSIPVVVTEGFGCIPMNSAAFNLLRKHARHEVALICPEIHLAAQAPEIVIPVASEDTPPPPGLPSHFRVGQVVRLTGYPRLGAVGRIVGLPARQQLVESGSTYGGMMVELEAGEQVFVPWTNAESLQ